jgi:oligopeptide transport system ATP-binding protein
VAMLEVNSPKTHFRTRCPQATEACGHEEPLWRKVSPVRWVACHWID